MIDLSPYLFGLSLGTIFILIGLAMIVIKPLRNFVRAVTKGMPFFNQINIGILFIILGIAIGGLTFI